MTWTVYRWDDASAPSLNYSGSSLNLLLKAVLVDGYGAKAAAGWTVDVLSSPGIMCFANAGSGKAVKVTHASNTAYANIVGSETTNGTGPFFPTTAQMASGGYVYVSPDATNRPWVIAADNKRFYLWIGAGSTTAQGVSGSGLYGQLVFAGDINPVKGDDGFHFMLMAGTSSGASGCYGASVQGGFTATLGHYIARGVSQAGTSVNCAKVSDYTIAQTTLMGAGGLSYPDASGGLVLAPVRVMDSASVLRGVMPGIWNPLHNIASVTTNPAQGDTFSGTGPLAGKTFILLNTYGNGASSGRIALETSNTVT